MQVKGNHPLSEIIAKCMSGVEAVPPDYRRRMVNKACREAVKYHEAALQSHNSAMVPCKKHFVASMCCFNKDMVCDFTPCLLSARHQ